MAVLAMLVVLAAIAVLLAALAVLIASIRLLQVAHSNCKILLQNELHRDQ